MTLRSTDFLTCYGFRRRACARLGSGVRHDRESSCELLVGPRRPLSTPASQDEAGLARRCLKHIAQGVRRLWRDPTGRFRTRRSIFKSVASTNFATGALVPVYPGMSVECESSDGLSRQTQAGHCWLRSGVNERRLKTPEHRRAPLVLEFSVNVCARAVSPASPCKSAACLSPFSMSRRFSLDAGVCAPRSSTV
jgi:hypothetical protein